MRFLQFCYQTTLVTLIVILAREFTCALRDVRVRVPHAVRRGEKAILKCFYNIEDDTLYSVKWYKGRREFYRYTPKETPPMKVFHFPGVKIKRIASNESQVVLDAVTMATSGKYSCEVSADAPSFHTLIAAAELEVIETPHNAPYMTGIRARYRVGDILRGNCTSRHSKPAANLTWTVNNEEVNPSHVRHHKIIRESRNDMETAIVGIHFVVTDQHFVLGKLKLRCNAQIHDIYWKTTEKTILETDQYAKHGSNVNMVSPDELYDQYSLQEGEMLHNKKNSYLTQLQGEGDEDGDGIGDEEEAAWRGIHSGAATAGGYYCWPRALALLAVLSWACKQLVQLQQLMPMQLSSPWELNNNNNNNNNTNKNNCNKKKQEPKATANVSSRSCCHTVALLLPAGLGRMQQQMPCRHDITAPHHYTNNIQKSVDMHSSDTNGSSSNYCSRRQLTLQT